MNILAIETSGDVCSCALLAGDDIIDAMRATPRDHTRFMLPMIDRLLARGELCVAQLDAIAFGRGPGSFTGVRIATAITQGLAFARALPVVPISSLRVLAQGACRVHGVHRVLAAFDARMGEVYWGRFTVGGDGLMGDCDGECVCPPDRVPVPAGVDWSGAGAGWAVHSAALERRLGGCLSGVFPALRPQARDLLPLARVAMRRGHGTPASRALPSYVRDRVAVPPARVMRHDT